MRQFIGMREAGGKRHRAAGLGEDVGLANEGTHGAANLLFADGDDIVDKLLQQLEGDGADRLRAQAIGNGAAGALGFDLDDVAGAEALLRVVGQLRLDGYDFGARSAQFNGRGDA